MRAEHRFQRDDPHLALQLFKINMTKRDVDAVMELVKITPPNRPVNLYCRPDVFGDDVVIVIEPAKAAE